MIRHFEASNFRMLVGNNLDLKQFHILVGPNGSGKTTFLDAFQFMSDIISFGAQNAVKIRTNNFYELCYNENLPIGLAIEAEFPNTEEIGRNKAVRYEIEVARDPKFGIKISRENLFLIPNRDEIIQPSLFGDLGKNILQDKHPKTWRKVVSKTIEGRDYFRDEKTQWNNMFKFGPDKAALGSLPEDPERFPLSIEVRNLLKDGIRTLALDARQMREPSNPGASTVMALDGSNLPHVVLDLQQRDPVLFEEWVQHVGTAINGLKGVTVRERPEDRFLVLEALFDGKHENPVPSWLLSDGTLRLMALTLLSFAATSDDADVYLVEEPENGLHPLAIETAFKSLSMPPGEMQFICATHSPIFISYTALEDVLVFRRAPQGYSILRHGEEVPELKTWSAQNNLADLLVTGVLS